VRNLLASCRN